MSKQAQTPKPSEPKGAQTFSVGYGRPPVHTRFQPGQSGNPKGRRKGQRNVRTVVDGELSQRIKVREGNRTRSLTKLDGFVVTLVNAALKGDAKAWTSLINLLRSLGMTGEPPAANDQKPYTADDEGLIADFLRRRGSEVQQQTESNDKEKDKEGPTDRTPSEWRTKP
jgi:hypothetical protein